MRKLILRMKKLFPGKSLLLLFLNIIGLFLVSLLEMLGVAVILPIVQLASGSPISGYIGRISDLMGISDRAALINVLGVCLVLSFVLKGILSMAIRWWSSGFIAKQQTATSVSLLYRLMHDTYINHRRRTTAEILRTINDAVSQAYSAYVSGLISTINEIFTILIIMMLLLIIMPVPALLAFVYFGLTAFALQFFLRKQNMTLGKAQLEASIGAMNAALESIVGFRETRLHGVTNRYIYKYQQKRLDSVEATRKSGFFQDLPKYVLEVIFIVGIALLLGFMSLQNEANAAPYLLLFAGACVRILPSYTRLVASLGSVRVGEEAVNLVIAEIDQLPKHASIELLDSSNAQLNRELINDRIYPVTLEIKDLSFRYPDSDKDTLEHISFTVPEGTSIAFVGGSGSGKTTLVDLLLGLYEPSSGAIHSNGQNIFENLSQWYSRVGYVPQDVFLGDSTVREAVAFGLSHEEIDEDRVWTCIEQAELTSVVNSLENGLDTMIGEHGTRLSGGQRQRLGIARALYRNPSLLILDEATSALDNDTEHKITQAINKIAQEITVVIVAHRLSTVKEANQLLFLSQGRIATQGTFEEVRQNNAAFAHLVRLGKIID